MFSIYDILALNEDGEENSSSSHQEQNQNNNAGLDSDEDFSIDTSLDDGGDINDNQQGDDNSGDDLSDDMGDESDNNSGEDSSEDGNESEANAVNTDIFASLTAEEQQIKIKELKKLFNSLYSSCDDILERINNLEVNEENLKPLSKISSTIYDIKIYISDYMTTIFPTKTYIENDVVFVRFLTIINSITDILEDISKKEEKIKKDNNSGEKD